jgi:septal ring factor EnvC (AmiA/AmiB activator)
MNVLVNVKLSNMKKLLLIGIITASFMACNNSADTTGDKKDSIDSALDKQKDKVDSIADKRKELIDTIKDRKIDSLKAVDSAQKK